MGQRNFVGFGFGAIQAGLFLYEAFRSGNFSRYVVAEVVPEVVEAVRAGGGRFTVNVATRHGLEAHTVSGVELYNPRVPADREALIAALAESDEICTALPSIGFFGTGEPGSVVDLLAQGLRRKAAAPRRRPAVLYTAENHNHAAEKLEEALFAHLGAAGVTVRPVFETLNTVIGKMSGVVTDEAQIREQRLARMVGAAGRALLVEEFNRILISRIRLPGFLRGLEVFQEKDDLLPFEEAKLYGHNATHALIGYLARLKRYANIADAAPDRRLLAFARGAFLNESGAALCRKHAGLDPLFTADGYRAYADDLLERMVNPHLRDAVERVIRDPRRKLGWDDRLVGTMRLAWSQGIEPRGYAVGAAAALRVLAAAEGTTESALVRTLWPDAPAAERDRVAAALLAALPQVDALLT
jgi:mannitol-1-phosphate 5-dehydrogenase